MLFWNSEHFFAIIFVNVRTWLLKDGKIQFPSWEGCGETPRRILHYMSPLSSK